MTSLCREGTPERALMKMKKINSIDYGGKVIGIGLAFLALIPALLYGLNRFLETQTYRGVHDGARFDSLSQSLWDGVPAHLSRLLNTLLCFPRRFNVGLFRVPSFECVFTINFEQGPIFNNSALNEMQDDIIRRIYEYFLNKFAPAVGVRFFVSGYS